MDLICRYVDTIGAVIADEQASNNLVGVLVRSAKNLPENLSPKKLEKILAPITDYLGYQEELNSLAEGDFDSWSETAGKARELTSFPIGPGGSCGNIAGGPYRCIDGACCSQFNWCGYEEGGHCNSRCQPRYSGTGSRCTRTPRQSPRRPSPSPKKSNRSPRQAPKTPSPRQPRYPVGPGGSCGDITGGPYRCIDGACCSKWNWCGYEAGHCQDGCQTEYGVCH